MRPADISIFSGISGFFDKEWNSLQVTLLCAESQKKIAEAFCGKHGICFSYNYYTGEIYTMLSLPSDTICSENTEEGALLNKCLNGTYVPGSTMKIVETICALDQKPDLVEYTAVCN